MIELSHTSFDPEQALAFFGVGTDRDAIETTADFSKISAVAQMGLDSQMRDYVLLENGSEPIARIRFKQIKDAVWSVRLFVDEKKRNRGYGSAALLTACRRLSLEEKVRRIQAMAPFENAACIRIFEKSGFVRLSVVPAEADFSLMLVRSFV